tara:strand:- start:2473 stop:2814 length:342 start_codon:yes stop_codon:yes gene_type:complete
MSDDERTAPVPGWPYEVTRNGKVRRVRVSQGSHGRWLKPQTNGSGYFQFCLCRDGYRQRITVHRIVLMAWHGPRPDGHTIQHLDGDRANNSLDNLRYKSRKITKFPSNPKGKC